MRISDWSSDVCSSDLPDQERRQKQAVVWSSASVAAGVGVSTGGPLRRNAAGSRPVDAVIVADAGRDRLSHRWTAPGAGFSPCRSEEHTSELQALMRHSYAGFILKKKT